MILVLVQGGVWGLMVIGSPLSQISDEELTLSLKVIVAFHSKSPKGRIYYQPRFVMKVEDHFLGQGVGFSFIPWVFFLGWTKYFTD